LEFKPLEFKLSLVFSLLEMGLEFKTKTENKLKLELQQER
jgi:hypothetical protein